MRIYMLDMPLGVSRYCAREQRVSPATPVSMLASCALHDANGAHALKASQQLNEMRFGAS